MSELEGGSSSATPGRPRRSTRAPAKTPTKIPAAAAPVASAARQKEKQKPKASATRDLAGGAKSPAERLEYLLTNPKSKLTKVDIAEVINYANFLELSEETQSRLCALLPETAFDTYVSSVCLSHPDYQRPLSGNAGESMDVDGPTQDQLAELAQGPATLDPAVFTSPFFLSAAHTFQDHQFSSWLGRKASEDLVKFEQGTRAGEMHADWKDDVWERDHQKLEVGVKGKKPAALDMTALARCGLLQQGDILAYKRAFPSLNVNVEKDVLIESIDPQSYAMVFVLAPGTRPALPRALLADPPTECAETVLSMTDIADHVALERGVLDVDGRVRASDKYELDAAACSNGPPAAATNGAGDDIKNLISVRAWKAFTVWRRRDEVTASPQAVFQSAGHLRGGRERVATLFYLRGCCSGSSSST